MILLVFMFLIMAAANGSDHDVSSSSRNFRSTTCPRISIFMSASNKNVLVENGLMYLGYKWILDRDIEQANISLNLVRLSCNCREKHKEIISEKKISRFIKITSIHLPPRIVQVRRNNSLTMEGYCGELFSIFNAYFNVSFELFSNKDMTFGILDDNMKWTGMIGDVIYGVMANYDYNHEPRITWTPLCVLFPIDSLFHALIGWQQSRFMHWLPTKHVADIAPCVTMSRTRRDYLAFSPALYSVRMEIIHLKLDYHDWDYVSFLKPFNQTIWLCLAAISLIIILASFYSNYVFTRQPFQNFASGFSNEILLCWPIVLQSKIPISKLCVSSLNSIKFCLGIYLLFSLLILSSYTSLLTALFATSKMKIPFLSLEDMVYETDYLPIILSGSTIQDFFEKSFKNQPFLEVNNAMEGIGNVVRKKAGFIMSLEIAASLINDNCSFSTAPKYAYSETITLAYQNKFPHMEFFRTKILELREHGILSAVHKRHIVVSMNCLEGKSLHFTSFRQIIGPVVLFLFGVLISVAFGLGEILYVRLWKCH